MSECVTHIIAEATYLRTKSMSGLTPDEDGVYRHLPLALIGAPSRNRTFYPETDFITAMQNKESPFYRRISTGQLFGEWNHPVLTKEMTEQEKTIRLLSIDMDRVSHHIASTKMERTLENGGKVITGDVTPFGIYGSNVDQSLRSMANSTFSLRAATQNSDIRHGNEIVSQRRVTNMITFDYVLEGGFLEASKAFRKGFSLEDCSQFSLTKGRGDQVIGMAFSLESIRDDEINEILKSTVVEVAREQTVVADTATVGGLKFASTMQKFIGEL